VRLIGRIHRAPGQYSGGQLHQRHCRAPGRAGARAQGKRLLLVNRKNSLSVQPARFAHNRLFGARNFEPGVSVIRRGIEPLRGGNNGAAHPLVIHSAGRHFSELDYLRSGPAWHGRSRALHRRGPWNATIRRPPAPAPPPGRRACTRMTRRRAARSPSIPVAWRRSGRPNSPTKPSLRLIGATKTPTLLRRSKQPAGNGRRGSRRTRTGRQYSTGVEEARSHASSRRRCAGGKTARRP
jgi:hypothetical protein